MCDTCPSHIPGPGEVGSGLIGLAVGAAISKPGRRVLFWTVAVPLFPFAVVGIFGWWTIALVALAAALSAAGLAYARMLHRQAVIARPEPTHAMRAALAARGLRPIPAPGQARPASGLTLYVPRKFRTTYALPRAMRDQLGRGRLTATVTGVRRHKPAQAIPAAAKVIEPTRVTGR